MSDRRYFVRQGASYGWEVAWAEPGNPPVTVFRGVSTSRGGRIAAVLAAAFEEGIEGGAMPGLGIVDLLTRAVRRSADDFTDVAPQDADDEQPRYGVCSVRTTEAGITADRVLVTAWTPHEAAMLVAVWRQAHEEGASRAEAASAPTSP